RIIQKYKSSSGAVSPADFALRAANIPSGLEVSRFGMVGDNRAGGLLGIELKFLAERDADALGLQEGPHLLLILETRARRVAEAVTAALVCDLDELAQLAGVAVGDAELHADLLVDVLGQGLGGLDARAVQVKVILVAILGEPFPGHVARAAAD